MSTNALATAPGPNPALLALSGNAAANSKSGPKNLEQIKATAKEFEAVFISEMFSHMFAGLPVDPKFGGGRGEEMFRSLLVNEYGKKMAQGPGIGIADQLQKTMIQMQEQTNQGAKQ